MRITIRQIFITLPATIAVLLLVAFAGPAPALAQQNIQIDLPKKAGLPNSCMTTEKAGNGGTYLRCRIVLPSGIPANMFIRAVFFSCHPGDGPACSATRECPGTGAICDRHPNPIEPVGYNAFSPGLRAVDWWGWTTDTGDATLRFDVTVAP
jgi:hypothetical protein